MINNQLDSMPDGILIDGDVEHISQDDIKLRLEIFEIWSPDGWQGDGKGVLLLRLDRVGKGFGVNPILHVDHVHLFVVLLNRGFEDHRCIHDKVKIPSILS